MPYEDVWRRQLTFDLHTEGLKSQGFEPSRVYRLIRVWMDEHGFDHEQLSVYVSKNLLSDRDMSRLTNDFAYDFPQVCACIEGISTTEIRNIADKTPDIRIIIAKEHPELLPILERSIAQRARRNNVNYA